MPKQTKSQAQRKALIDGMNTGPFTWSGDATNFSRTNTAALSTMDYPFRLTDDRFDENDADTVRGVIDCEHARALAMGKQTASQFGYGIYDIEIMLRPNEDALSPALTKHSLGDVMLSYFPPTPLRMDALKHLKALEILDDAIDGVTTLDGTVDGVAVNPLLSTPLDIDESAATDYDHKVAKGSKIIRFGWSGQAPYVCRQSAYTQNLNPDVDRDTNDAYEQQYYVLIGGDNEHFGILQRMEAAVNPIIDATGNQRLVEEEWAFPVSTSRVDYATRYYQPITWGLGDSNASSSVLTAKFTGIAALGGLIGVGLPRFYTDQAGTENNDFDLTVVVKGRKWVPMA